MTDFVQPSLKQRMPYMRVTSFSVFEDCPYKWATQFLAGRPSPPNKYAKAGTAVHTIVESYLRQCMGQPPIEDVERAWFDIDVNERPNVTAYINGLQATIAEGWRPFALELPFEMPMADDMPIIRGHIDVLWITPSGLIVIGDHKTNRQPETVDQWANKLQPMLYSWAVRQMYGVDEVGFWIGYVNQKHDVKWETTSADDVALLSRMSTIWEKMQHYYTANDWPQTLNTYCGFCPMRTECEVAVSSVANFPEKRAEVSKLPLPEQYEWAKHVAKLAKAFEDDLSEQMRAKITELNGRFQHGDAVFSLKPNVRRQATFAEVWGKAVDIINTENDAVLAAEFISVFDDVFSVKITELDAAIKSTPALAPLRDCITKKETSQSIVKERA